MAVGNFKFSSKMGGNKIGDGKMKGGMSGKMGSYKMGSGGGGKKAAYSKNQSENKKGEDY